VEGQKVFTVAKVIADKGDGGEDGEGGETIMTVLAFRMLARRA